MGLGIAKVLNNMGATKLATKVVEYHYGPQIGKVSKSGMRGFQQQRIDGKIETVVFDKNFNVHSKMTKKSTHSDYLTTFERVIYNKFGAPSMLTKMTKSLGLSKRGVYMHEVNLFNCLDPSKVVYKHKWSYNSNTGQKKSLEAFKAGFDI